MGRNNLHAAPCPEQTAGVTAVVTHHHAVGSCEHVGSGHLQIPTAAGQRNRFQAAQRSTPAQPVHRSRTRRQRRGRKDTGAHGTDVHLVPFITRHGRIGRGTQCRDPCGPGSQPDSSKRVCRPAQCNQTARGHQKEVVPESGSLIVHHPPRIPDHRIDNRGGSQSQSAPGNHQLRPGRIRCQRGQVRTRSGHCAGPAGQVRAQLQHAGPGFHDVEVVLGAEAARAVPAKQSAIGVGKPSIHLHGQHAVPRGVPRTGAGPQMPAHHTVAGPGSGSGEDPC